MPEASTTVVAARFLEIVGRDQAAPVLALAADTVMVWVLVLGVVPLEPVAVRVTV
ncbi:MAG: hypothetical protein V9H25_17000 [Candidatus Competibacter sp.]